MNTITDELDYTELQSIDGGSWLLQKVLYELGALGEGWGNYLSNRSMGDTLMCCM